MPEAVEQILIYLHLLSALYWVGGNLLFISFGMSMRHVYKSASLVPGFRALGRTFRVGTWISVFLLVLTGTLLLIYRWGGVDTDMVIKLVLFGILLPLKALHDFYIASRAAKENPPAFYFKLTMLVARLNLLIALLIIYFSMRFVR